MKSTRVYLRSPAELRHANILTMISPSITSIRLSSTNADFARLGLPPTASKSEIKAAYFQKAKELHPDSSGGAGGGGEEFSNLNAAYKRLMEDPNKRYGGDQYGEPRPKEYWEEMYRRQRHQERMNRKYPEDFDFTWPKNKRDVDMDNNIRVFFFKLILSYMLINILISHLGIGTRFKENCRCEECLAREVKFRRMQEEYSRSNR